MITHRKRCKKKSTFTAKFTGKAPCWVCQLPIEKGTEAKWDFSTGTKRVIHADCEAGEQRATAKDMGWTPSDEQQDIVDTAIASIHSTRDPLHMMVEALAGTGKTATIELLLNEITRKHFFPDTLPFAQYLVFGADNAVEATIKIDPMIATASTIHSLGFKECKKAFTMNSRPCKNKLEFIYKDNIYDFNGGTSTDEKTFLFHVKRLTKMRKLIEKAKNLCIRPGTEFMNAVNGISTFYDIDVPTKKKDTDFLHDCNKVFEVSVEDTSRADFDDMVYLLWFYHVKIEVPENIKLLCVDEWQDQNPLRIWLVTQYMNAGLHIIIVGDSYQAIMGFSGALTDSMEKGAEMLGESVVRMPLTINRRTDNLHVIEYVRDRYIPELQAHPGATYGFPVTEYEADRFEEVMSMVRHGDVILGRTNAPNIDMYLRMLETGRGATILGRENVEQIMSLFARFADEYGCKTAVDFIMTSHLWEDQQFQKTRNQLKRARIEDQANSVRAICHGLPATASIHDVKALVTSMFSNVTNGDRGSLVTLASTHKSKGLEWPRVFVLTHVDGKSMFPHPRVTNEDLKQQEMNLLYAVACLRAQHELHLFQLDTQEG